MSSPAQPHRPNITPAMAPIGPSIVVKLMVAPMSRMLNPLVGKLAGRRHFPMAQIHHVGRRSGNHYVTSVGARVNGDVVLVPLTFGNRSDWARNVIAARGCSIRLRGRSYQAVQPHLIAWGDSKPLVRATFGRLQPLGFRLLGIKQFMRLQIS
jgi:deazaflavin-dependent oxidoreductase (nitroreductase family)